MALLGPSGGPWCSGFGLYTWMLVGRESWTSGPLPLHFGCTGISYFQSGCTIEFLLDVTTIYPRVIRQIGISNWSFTSFTRPQPLLSCFGFDFSNGAEPGSMESMEKSRLGMSVQGPPVLLSTSTRRPATTNAHDLSLSLCLSLSLSFPLCACACATSSRSSGERPSGSDVYTRGLWQGGQIKSQSLNGKGGTW